MLMIVVLFFVLRDAFEDAPVLMELLNTGQATVNMVLGNLVALIVQQLSLYICRQLGLLFSCKPARVMTG